MASRKFPEQCHVTKMRQTRTKKGEILYENKIKRKFENHFCVFPSEVKRKRKTAKQRVIINKIEKWREAFSKIMSVWRKTL